MKQIWFKAKRYGWGWYPATWQGWSVLIIYVGLIIWYFVTIDRVSHSASDTLMSFFPKLLILTLLLLWVCYRKGETPGWHWGDKK